MAHCPPTLEALTARLVALEDTVHLHMSYQDRAVAEAAKQMTIRLDHANGLIVLLKEQAVLWMPRAESVMQHAVIERRLDLLTKQVQEMNLLNVRIAALAAGAGGLLGAVLSWWVHALSK